MDVSRRVLDLGSFMVSVVSRTLFKLKKPLIMVMEISGYHSLAYRISSDIRRIFFFQNNPQDLDPSYKTDLDL